MRAATAATLCLIVTALAAAGCNDRRPTVRMPPPMADAGPPDDAGIVTRPPVDPPEVVEECNGLDDDGDGSVDEVCNCELGATQECFPAAPTSPVEERCVAGTQTCAVNGEFTSWGECTGWQACDPIEDGFVYGEETVTRPVDIVWMIDQSGSMYEEIANVQANINRFATSISSSGVDYRVIMMSLRGGTYGVCVPEPLAGPGCADSERLRQLEINVQSTDALSLVQYHIDAIEAHMRPGSLRVFVVVTDDNSYLPATTFDAWARARPGFEDYLFSGIIAESYTTCPTIASPGTEYVTLAGLTGGSIENLCSSDWGATFDRLSGDIVVRTLVYPLTAVPFDPTELRVFFVDASGVETEQPAGTWSYDPAQNAIVLADGATPPPGTTIVVRYRETR